MLYKICNIYVNCRNTKPSLKDLTLESKKLSPCKNTLILVNKKCLNSLPGAPYRDSMKQSLSEDPKSYNKSNLGQRVMSAKMLRFKQLQNQLADAHYHLNELANENRLLKALQKRQDSALRRYEGANAELPKLINSHHEELRVLQTKYKKLKELHKNTCNLLKEKENELYSANSQNKHLLQLSKDRNLEEREKLQLQLSDMNYKMQQQQETIQLLHRKLALETKSLKHQLHVEISKHKDTQKNLQETIEKLKNLECLLDNREKRLYCNGQLPIYSKEKNLGSHSLTNLKDVSTSNLIKTSSRSRRSENNTSKDNLPSLDVLESNDDEKITKLTGNINHNRSIDHLKSETMASLQQIRKFRLQRSPHIRKNAYSMDDLRFRLKDLEKTALEDEKVTSTDYKEELQERDELNNDSNESGKLRKFFSRIKNQNSQKLEKKLRAEFNYSSDDGDSENASEYYIQSYDTPKKSRELFARLINSTDTSDTLEDAIKKTDYSDEEKEELNARLAKDLTFQKHEYKKSKLEVLHRRINDLYDSDSDTDHEETIPTNAESFINFKNDGFQANLSNNTNEFSKTFNGVIHSEYSTPDVDQSVKKLKGTELQRISDNTLNDIENIGTLQHISNKTWQEQQFLEDNEIDDSSMNIKKEDCTKDEGTKYLADKPICTEMYDKFDTDSTPEEIKNLPSLKENEVENQACEKESTINPSNKSDQPIDNLAKEYLKLETDEIIYHSNERTSNKNEINTEVQNKSDASLKDVNALSNNVPTFQTEQNHSAKSEMAELKQASDKKKVINFNKEKLLATMKAIDNNENIEFLSQGFKNHNVNRMQMMENLHRGLPAHSKPKRDIIRDIFEDNHIESKVRSTCSKSH
ncbi:hypothetical protein PUN28_017397 [Cardiocondyla obscurior]|uniref:Lebercilin domain-containing protein n=1 Tax=Cardiocondyla obscurior TaxID=286306 RepID=A0AAW2EQW2_9HYME